MNPPAHIAAAARKRVREQSEQIAQSLRAIAEGRPGDAEPEGSRRAAVLGRRIGLSYEDAARAMPRTGAEKVWGKTIDFVDVAFLERGVHAARAVARVATPDSQGLGTGFMISPRLFLTNNHVIESGRSAQELVIEFDYERDLRGRQRPVTRFRFAPEICFITCHEDDLDYTVVAIGERIVGRGELRSFGFLPISASRDKHQLGDHVNIIQHPDGRLKEAVLRENQLVSRAKTALHYVADTEPGSSGSPVFNVLWQPVALHHWGSPYRDLIDDAGVPIPKTVNEGIRISAIVSDLNTRKTSQPATSRTLITEALAAGLDPEATLRSDDVQAAHTDGASGLPFELGTDGTATWTIPLRLSIQIGGMDAALPARLPARVEIMERAGNDSFDTAATNEVRVVVDRNYESRGGYDPEFLGVLVPLPGLATPAARSAAARSRQPTGDDPHELRYEHFSVVMNGKRRLAFFTATNIDGAQAKSYDRRTGRVSDIVREDDEDAAEAAEQWFLDDRIKDSEQTPPDFYKGQTALDAQGMPITDKRKSDHMNRIFQQGHLTRRQDPLWGDDEVIIRANADTFHVTNRAPQVGFFNMGVYKREAESGGGQLHWRALEDYALNNAQVDRERVTVFTGPICDDENDYPWDRGRADMEGFKAPREYWKIVVRVEYGELRATALIADQSPLIDYVPEVRYSDEEAKRVSFEQVKRYQVSIREIQERTGLDFGKEVLAADTYQGGERREVSSIITLLSSATDTASAKRGRAAQSKALPARKGGRRTGGGKG